MNTHQKTQPGRNRFGFTLVELLVGMTVIAILAGLLTVAVGGAFKAANEFTVKNEMTQIEAALEQFNNEFGFYPPSFKEFENISNIGGNNNNNIAAANAVLNFINRIAPNNAESQVIDQDFPGQRRIDLWWNNVGQFIGDNPGSELVFWLSSLSKNRQFPLTFTDPTSNPPQVFALTAHNQSSLAGAPERQIFFEFDATRFLNFDPDNNVLAVPLQPTGDSAYLYRDAGINYFPNNPSDPDDIAGAYVNASFADPLDGDTIRRPMLIDIVNAFAHLGGDDDNPNDISSAASKTIFNRIFPNPDSYQLISFGLDGMPGGPTTCPTEQPANPNIISSCCSAGADNFVNFGSSEITKLEIVLENLN